MTENDYNITSETEIPVYFYSKNSTPIATVSIGFFKLGYSTSRINTGNKFLNKQIDRKDALLFMDFENQKPFCIVVMSEIGYDGLSFRDINNRNVYPLKIDAYDSNDPPRNEKLNEFIEKHKKEYYD